MCKKVEESADEKPFELSEMYVFGKFAAFKTRIIKVRDDTRRAVSHRCLVLFVTYNVDHGRPRSSANVLDSA